MSSAMRTIFYDFKANVGLELPSRRRLIKRLGEYDSLAEYTFLAVRDFEANWDGTESHEDYISTKAKLRNVNLRNGVTLPQHELTLIKSFLVNSHAMLEDFVDQYKIDIRNLIDSSFCLDGSDKLSKEERLLNPLRKNDIQPLFPIWLLPVLKYYRLLRNSVAHDKMDMQSCEDAYNEIDKELLNADYPVFAGKTPNTPNELTIEDFYFYSACIKHFANYLTMALKGKVDWSNLGNIHESFNVSNFKKGTQPIPLINVTLRQYNHKPTKEEISHILSSIKEQKITQKQ